jgi:predicted dehydrogenase
MSAQVRVGVIGCGWWSSNAHLPALSRNDKAVIAGLADPNADALRAASERYPVRSAFRSAEEMFAAIDLDAVVIAVPHASHFAVALLALENDVHVLLEKPMVLEPGHGRILIDEARRRKRELVIGYPWHYNTQVLAVRSAIAEGIIGELEFVSCLFASIVRELYRGNPSAYETLFEFSAAATPGSATYSDPAVAGGGQGQTQVTHAAALLFWLTALRPRQVAAYAEPFELAVDLCDAVAMRFDGGAVGTLASTGSMLPGHQEQLEYRLFGRDGHVLFDVNNGVCSIHRSDGTSALLPRLPPADRYPQAAPVDNLVRVARGEEENGSPPEIGLLAVEFLDAMYRSAGTGAFAEI